MSITLTSLDMPVIRSSIRQPSTVLLLQACSLKPPIAQSPLCSPSRLSLLTGKWVSHCSAWSNGAMLNPEHETIPGWLGKHGYTTAKVGKMHVNGGDRTHGFQYRPYGDLVAGRTPMHQPDPPETGDGRWNNHALGRLQFAGPTEIPESLLVDKVITTESLAWLLEYSDQNPRLPLVFLRILLASPFSAHGPWTLHTEVSGQRPADADTSPWLPRRPPPHDRFIVDDFSLLKFSSEEHRRAVAAYYACVDYVDDCIGELLEGLRRAGGLDNTYIVYTSDHGDMAGEHGLWWKRSYYEASARVPLLVSGPGIASKTTESTPVELVDLFPTFCDWAGIETPEALDGESILPILEGHPEQRQKKAARCDYLDRKTEVQFMMVRDERWKYVEFPDASPLLFDLVNDPDELHNLADNPPPEAPLEHLRALLLQSGTWEEMAKARAADQERTRQPSSEPRRGSTVQYRLSDGRIIDADSALYETG